MIRPVVGLLVLFSCIAWGRIGVGQSGSPGGDADHQSLEASARRFDASSLPGPFRSTDWKTAWRSGNVRAGEKLFQLRCVACHSIDETTPTGTPISAPSVGPILTGVADRLTPEFMAQSIISPSQDIAENYQAWQAVTVDGDVVVGHRLEKSVPSETTIQTMNGQLISLDTDDIELLVKSDLSVMPVGLVAEADEVKDLTAYLMMLSRKPSVVDRMKTLRQRWAEEDAAERARLIAEGSFAIPEFDTGRAPPVPPGSLSLGSGLAMSRGYIRGVPLGEMEGWSVSVWFQPNSETEGDVFGLVLNAAKAQAVRVTCESGNLSVRGPGRKNDDPGWSLDVGQVALEKWHHLVITRAQGVGLKVYLNGRHAAEKRNDQLGYGQSFNDYHFGAAVTGIQKNEAGQTQPILGNFFDGLIDDFAMYERPLSNEEVSQLHVGETIGESLVAFNDFENVSHRELAGFVSNDESAAYLDEGRRLFESNCTQCHSPDGIQPSKNPLARNFTQHKMENGGDPYSMFRTITYGFRNMMAATQLSPDERYQVIHYIREKMVREHAPQLYVPTNEAYTDSMPNNPRGSGEEAARIEALAKVGYLRDYGRALIAPVRGNPDNRIESVNALVVDLGNETTIAYDLGTMSTLGAWKGGFLDFSNTLHHKLRAPGLPLARFNAVAGQVDWHWAWDGDSDAETPDIEPRTVWPKRQLDYRGHYPYGDNIIISYRVQGRGVLDSPMAIGLSSQDENSGENPGGAVIVRRMTIGPGENELELVIPVIEDADLTIAEDSVAFGTTRSIALQFGPHQDSKSVYWKRNQAGDLVLSIASSPSSMSFNLVAHEAVSAANLPTVEVTDLTTRTTGGPKRWTTTHTMKGKIAGDRFQGYVMDSIPVPLKNAYNTWMRTASLAFYPDGRLAVATLSGDVWIVSGINDELDGVTWQRFAAGLYEPLGMKVVDDVLTVGTRGRIVKLHDFNADGEADFYEAFFNEPEPDPGWHAYSFDLEVGDDGAYYYARVGGFSDWSVPGGMVRVAPDGESWEVVGAGMRVPNGIGRLPDGRITFGDNQGTYVPASKIAITQKGAFHGAGKWPNRDGDYDPEKIVEPIVYMPQELDSSSGGQLWVDADERFGPLSGQFFHTSYGRARTMVVMIDEFNDITQGAVFPVPLKMESGTMRLAKNEIDGQLYFSGLTGWQAGATREGSIQRMRFTGQEGLYLTSAIARKGRLELKFNRPIDPASLGQLSEWKAEAWNYKWSQQYGSPNFKVTDPNVQGTNLFPLESLELLDGDCTVRVNLPELLPCHTLKLDFRVESVDTHSLTGPVYFTIHELPE